MASMRMIYGGIWYAIQEYWEELSGATNMDPGQWCSRYSPVGNI